MVCLRNAHDKAWLSLIEAGIDQALSGGSQDIDIVDKAQDPGRFSFSSQAWQQVDSFREAIFDSRAPDLAWALLGSEALTLLYDFLIDQGGVYCERNYTMAPGSCLLSTPWNGS